MSQNDFIKLRKSDINNKNNIIINNDTIKNLKIYFNLMDLNISDITKKKIKDKYKDIDRGKNIYTYDCGNITGILIFTILNNQSVIIYYNFFVFKVIHFNINNIYLNDNILFTQNTIIYVQEIDLQLYKIYVIYDDNITYNNYIDFFYDNNIYIKKRNYNKKIINDYINYLPFKDYIKGIVKVNKDNSVYYV